MKKLGFDCFRVAMKFYLPIVMIRYEQTIPSEEMRTVITLELVLWLIQSMAYNL